VLAERAAWDLMTGNADHTTLTTILPGAVFGPLLTAENLGSVQVIQRLLEGRPPGIPRLGFSVVDVRDLADLHIRAMTAPNAAGQRFLATGDFMWMKDIAGTLRARLGERAARVRPARCRTSWCGFLRFSSRNCGC
jgi:nucleoside-diphosphate-sugar epimerase